MSDASPTTPGWYPDPRGGAGRLRYWDGASWSEYTRTGTSAGDLTSHPTATESGQRDVLASGVAHPWGSWRASDQTGPVPPTQAPAGGTAGREPRGPSPWARLRKPGILVAVLVAFVVLIVIAGLGLVSMVSRGDGAQSPLGGPGVTKPPLAQACPPPTADPPPPPPASPAPPMPGPRVTDTPAGISYGQPAGPWKPWTQGVWSQGTLGVQFRTGYFFVTEIRPRDGSDYLASVLSGSVPATVNDGTTLDLECTGHQVAEDVRESYYPRPNTKESVRDERVSLGGRPAWVSTFRLRFSEAGLRARSELVGVVLVDVGKPTAAVLYLSIPDTHKQYEADVDRVIASVKPI